MRFNQPDRFLLFMRRQSLARVKCGGGHPRAAFFFLFCIFFFLLRDGELPRSSSRGRGRLPPATGPQRAPAARYGAPAGGRKAGERSRPGKATGAARKSGTARAAQERARSRKSA